MRKNISKVIDLFNASKSGKGDSAGTCYTDGRTIFSYAMPIATRLACGSVVLVSYDSGPSRTTKSQIRACEMGLLPVSRPDCIKSICF